MPSVREYAFKILSRREHSVFEFREKLKEKFPEKEQERAQVEQEFIDHQWVSDERFLESYLHDEQQRAQNGSLKIFQKLRQKGIDEEEVKKKIKEFFPEEREQDTAIRLANQKRKEIRQRGKKLSELEIQQRVLRFLVGKGYSFDRAMRSVRKK